MSASAPDLERQALSIARGLLADGYGPDFFVYSDGASVRVAVGCTARVRMKAESLTLDVEGAESCTVATRDPFAELAGLIARAAAGGRGAYGYIAFDVAGFYHEYVHRSDVLLDFVVPRVECVLRPDGPTVNPPELTARVRELAAASIEARSTAVVVDVFDGLALFDKRVHAAHEAVRAGGDLAKVIVSRTVTLAGRLDPLSSYEHACSKAAVRRYAFRLGNLAAAGIPPGLVMTAERDGAFAVNPLAGTMPRGATPEADALLRRTLLRDSKEVNEHAMVVRLAQEQILPLCAPNTFRISDFMEVRLLPFTQHLSSRVEGRLRPGLSAWDAVRAVFPAVTVTGVPKAEAIRLISAVEPAPRGPYAGAVGFATADGLLDLAVALRSVFETNGVLSLSAGAGIVADSVLPAELEESTNKLRTMAGSVRVVERSGG